MMKATTAERCIFVDLQGKKGRELVPMLDEFAKNLSLEVNKSDPVNPIYSKTVLSGSLQVEVSYLIGLGSFSAVLSLTRYDNDKNADLVMPFDTFVLKSTAPKYKVTPCAQSQFPPTYR